MGRGRDKRRARRPRDPKRAVHATKDSGSPINLVHWNINGLLRDDNIEHLAEVLVSENIDICLLNETHLKYGYNDDLSAFNPFTVYSKERTFGSKKGGGIMTIVRPGLNHSRWDPGLVMFPYLDAERAWILIHEGDSKIAVCAVYCAAEVLDGNCRAWNFDLFAMIKYEIETIKADGFECLIVGDLNGHVGNDNEGIPNNLPHVNYNGTLIRDFVSSSNLRIVNADRTRCNGVFTRVTANSISCLDYVLEEVKERTTVSKMTVDVNNEILGGSDHSAVFIELAASKVILDPMDVAAPRIPNPTPKTASVYARVLDDMLAKLNWSSLSLDEKCTQFQELAVQAAQTTCPPESTRRTFKSSKAVRRIRTRCILLESSVRKREAAVKLGMGVDTSLQSDREKASALRIRFKDMVQERRKRKRVNIRRCVKINTKQFWALARKVEKKSGSLSAIKDENGVLITNAALLEKIVLEQLALIFSGQRSPVFTHRGEQLIKEATAGEISNWKEWIVPESDCNEHEAEVCATITLPTVSDLVSKLKRDRAPGVDGVSSAMLMAAGPLALELLTDMFNHMLRIGRVPDSLQTGKMTLIDKKQPSLEVKGKRPLTVSSVLLNLFTKIVHSRMNPICEREGYYGPVQYGFRTGRSTSDCVLIILAAVRKAKAKNHAVSLAFCDIAKAYDSVDRELLYCKLDAVGFGGRVKSLIQSMYYNDCVRVRLGNGLSSPLWFTKGVKQGCVLSPLLFALYVSGLGKILHSSKEGVSFSGVVVSALLFADDLVLISRTRIRGMNKLLRTVHRFCTNMRMRLAVEKTVILSSGPVGGRWVVSGDEPSLEASLVAKYLGVDLSIKGRNLVRAREARMISTARAYAHTIMGCTRTGLDRSATAHRLWEGCAIPAVLYAVEAMVVSKTTVMELEKIQASVARFILQLPRSASKVVGYTDAGLMPIEHRIIARTLVFLQALSNKKKDPIIKGVLSSVFEDVTDPWTTQVKAWSRMVGLPSVVGVSRARVWRQVEMWSVSKVQSMIKEHRSLVTLSEPSKWFSLQPHVNDSAQSRILNRFRAADVGLGNRRPNLFGESYKICPLCLEDGFTYKLNETHVILVCPAVGFTRHARGIEAYMSGQLVRQVPAELVMRGFLGGDGADPGTMMARANDLQCVLDDWLRQVSLA